MADTPKNPEKHCTYVPSDKKSTKAFHSTPMLDQLEDGPWPSFVTGLKRLAHDNNMMVDLMGQLEYSYNTRLGYWKGGTVSVFGYGGGIIPRFTELMGADGKAMFPDSKEFHTLRVQPPAGNHYTTDMLRKLSNSWNKYGSGLIAFHGQTGNIMFIGTTTENTQHFFDEVNEYGWDLGGAGPCVRTAMSCVGAARCEQSNCNEMTTPRSARKSSRPGCLSRLSPLVDTVTRRISLRERHSCTISLWAGTFSRKALRMAWSSILAVR